ncbi:MAG: protein CrdC [Myxococcaceae bacterium]|nr:protein CrdC [Myxococcaceae bacterium]
MKPIDGIALCRVGEARLAFPCDEIDAIAAVGPDALGAALAFGDVGSPEGKALAHGHRLLQVDSVDVLATTALAVLPVPAVIARAAGGALAGFVLLAGDLWPIVSVGGLLDFLESRRSGP